MFFSLLSPAVIREIFRLLHERPNIARLQHGGLLLISALATPGSPHSSAQPGRFPGPGLLACGEDDTLIPDNQLPELDKSHTIISRAEESNLGDKTE